MKLTQLRYFLATCDSGSIRKATEILHVSQPSVSAAIQELEKEFEVELFTRESRMLHLTEEGRILYRLAGDLLKQADQVEFTMHALRERERTLRIGIPPMIGSVLLPKLSFQNITLTEGGREELLSKLASNQIDFAFLPHDTPFPEQFISVPVMNVETVFCTTEKYPEQRKISFDELDRKELVLFQSNFFHNEIITSYLKQTHSNPRVLFETSQLSTFLSMIRSGKASGFLFKEIAMEYPDIRYYSTDPALYVQISLVRNARMYLFKEANEFVEQIKMTL